MDQDKNSLKSFSSNDYVLVNSDSKLQQKGNSIHPNRIKQKLTTTKNTKIIIAKKYMAFNNHNLIISVAENTNTSEAPIGEKMNPVSSKTNLKIIF